MNLWTEIDNAVYRQITSSPYISTKVSFSIYDMIVMAENGTDASSSISNIIDSIIDSIIYSVIQLDAEHGQK
jgi:hypothetical protein